MHVIEECLICGSKNLHKKIECIDYTVSHETFKIDQCEECGFLFTNPQPQNNELARYYLSDSYISHSDNSRNLVDKIYKISRSWALGSKLTQVKKFTTPVSSLLDYGCGTGYFLETCQKANIRVSGVEPSSIARSLAITRTSQHIHQSLASVTESFDAITLWHVLEHIADLNETLTQLICRLNKNGTIFIAVPNHNSYDAKKYQQHWAAWDVPRHLWHFDQRTMPQLLDKHELTIIQQLPMKLDAYYVSMLSEKYRTQSSSPFNLVNGFLNGLRSNIRAKNNNYSSIIYVAKRNK